MCSLPIKSVFRYSWDVVKNEIRVAAVKVAIFGFYVFDKNILWRTNVITLDVQRHYIQYAVGQRRYKYMRLWRSFSFCDPAFAVSHSYSLPAAERSRDSHTPSDFTPARHHFLRCANRLSVRCSIFSLRVRVRHRFHRERACVVRATYII